MQAVLGDAGQWTPDTYLLAAAVDNLGVLASEMRWKKAPEFIRRPGAAPPPKRTASAVDIRAELEKRRARSRKKNVGG